MLLFLNAGLPPFFVVSFFTGHPSLPFFFATTLSAHLLLLVAIMHPRCAWLGPVFSRFETSRREVWLTIDDGPSVHTEELAKELARRKVRATFFVIGQRLLERPEAVGWIQGHGHTLANHTATHPRKSFWCLPEWRVQKEMMKCAELLDQMGAPGVFFRPPVGHKPPALAPVARAAGSCVVAWSAGGRDGWKADAEPLIGRIRASLRPGAILLLHEGRSHSIFTILSVVDVLLSEGWTFMIPEPSQLRA
jgi:peptidoglycan/xylan/chitin deacetylase (PgdA/CDA1 family)